MTDGYIIANYTPIVKVLYLFQWLTVYRGLPGMDLIFRCLLSPLNKESNGSNKKSHNHSTIKTNPNPVFGQPAYIPNKTHYLKNACYQGGYGGN